MDIKNLCQQAIINLNAAKLRSFLAVLGILVGTAAVVALISSGQLATDKALAELKALGTDLMAITVFKKEQSPSRSNNSIGNSNSNGTFSENKESLSLALWQQIPESIP